IHHNGHSDVVPPQRATPTQHPSPNDLLQKSPNYTLHTEMDDIQCELFGELFRELFCEIFCVHFLQNKYSKMLITKFKCEFYTTDDDGKGKNPCKHNVPSSSISKLIMCNNINPKVK